MTFIHFVLLWIKDLSHLISKFVYLLNIFTQIIELISSSISNEKIFNNFVSDKNKDASTTFDTRIDLNCLQLPMKYEDI